MQVHSSGNLKYLTFDFLDKAMALSGNRGDNGAGLVKQAAHRADESGGQTFHFANFVHQIKVDLCRGIERLAGHAVKDSGIDCVFPYALALWEADMRHDMFFTIKGAEVKADALSRFADLCGIEAGEPLVR